MKKLIVSLMVVLVACMVSSVMAHDIINGEDCGIMIIEPGIPVPYCTPRYTHHYHDYNNHGYGNYQYYYRDNHGGYRKHHDRKYKGHRRYPINPGNSKYYFPEKPPVYPSPHPPQGEGESHKVGPRG